MTWADGLTLAVSLLALGLGLGDYPLYEPHEGHFGAVAAGMLWRGDGVVPTLNGAPYLNKPPLLYWLIAISQGLFGQQEWAVRLPLLLGGWMGCLAAWQWGRQLRSPVAGRWAAIALSTSLGWFLFVHQVSIDIWLGSLLLAVYYCLWRLLWANQYWRRYMLCLYGLLGLCFLVKGPIGLFFPALAGIALLIIRGQWKTLQQLRLGWGVLVLLAVVLPWAIAIEVANPGFWQYFLVNEHLRRVADVRWPPDYAVSKVGAAGFLGLAVVWGLPWAIFLPATCRHVWGEWQRGRGDGAGTEERRRSEGLLLLVVGAVAPIALFLPMSSRLVYYSLPAIPPTIVLTADWGWSQYEQWRHRGQVSPFLGWKGRVWGAFLLVAGLAIASAALWAPQWILPQLPFTDGSALKGILVALMLSLGLSWGLGGFCLPKRPITALLVLVFGAVGTHYAVTCGFVALQDRFSSKTLIELANPRLGISTVWFFEGSRELGAAGAMSFYLNGNGTLTLAEVPCRQKEPGQLLMGWARGRGETAYRIVQVLENGGPNRILPAFPGDRPTYATTAAQLNEYWDSDAPAVFLTDFLRRPNDPTDPVERNLPRDSGQPLAVIESRQLYGNRAARHLWELAPTDGESTPFNCFASASHVDSTSQIGISQQLPTHSQNAP